jgi:phenylacetate-CoA ligase
MWDPRVEEMPPEELKRLQYRLLKTLVYRLYSFSNFYHERMRAAGVHPDDVKTLDDIAKLPFMYKSDLRDNYPDRIFTASQDELVRYHVSSGTTGKPTVVGYTANDLEIWTTSLARSLTACADRDGEHRAADRADAGPARDGDRLHPVLPRPPGRDGRADGGLDQERHEPAGGDPGGRTLV